MKSLKIINFIIAKTFLIFIYIYIFTLLLSYIFPKYDEDEYNKYTIPKLLYELILETILLFMFIFSSKCLTNIIVTNYYKDYIHFIRYVPHSLLISIMFITFNLSYRYKLRLLKNKIIKD